MVIWDLAWSLHTFLTLPPPKKYSKKQSVCCAGRPTVIKITSSPKQLSTSFQIPSHNLHCCKRCCIWWKLIQFEPENTGVKYFFNWNTKTATTRDCQDIQGHSQHAEILFISFRKTELKGLLRGTAELGISKSGWDRQVCNSYEQPATRRRQGESILELRPFSNNFSHATEAFERKPGHTWLLISKLLVFKILLLHICYITRS